MRKCTVAHLIIMILVIKKSYIFFNVGVNSTLLAGNVLFFVKRLLKYQKRTFLFKKDK